IEERVRAGVLEHKTVDLMRQTGVAARLDREGLQHDGIYIAFNGERHHIDMTDLVGRAITVYAQHEIIKDLVAARLAAGGEILFETKGLTLHGMDSAQPSLRFTHNDEEHEIVCDFIGGCD